MGYKVKRAVRGWEMVCGVLDHLCCQEVLNFGHLQEKKCGEVDEEMRFAGESGT